MNDRSLEIYCIASSGSFWPIAGGAYRPTLPCALPATVPFAGGNRRPPVRLSHRPPPATPGTGTPSPASQNAPLDALLTDEQEY